MHQTCRASSLLHLCCLSASTSPTPKSRAMALVPWLSTYARKQHKRAGNGILSSWRLSHYLPLIHTLHLLALAPSGSTFGSRFQLFGVLTFEYWRRAFHAIRGSIRLFEEAVQARLRIRALCFLQPFDDVFYPLGAELLVFHQKFAHPCRQQQRQDGTCTSASEAHRAAYTICHPYIHASTRHPDI